MRVGGRNKREKKDEYRKEKERTSESGRVLSPRKERKRKRSEGLGHDREKRKKKVESAQSAENHQRYNLSQFYWK
jgi:hypothetical protein